MGKRRTITVQGTFTGVVNIQFSNEGAGGPWATALTFAGTGKKSIDVAARFMRIVRAGVSLIIPGLPVVDVGSDDIGGLFADIPATPGNGTGAPVDVSAFGTFNTIACLGTFRGTTVIEISEDGASWATCATFNQSGWINKEFVAQFMRVTRKNLEGVNFPGLPNVDVGAINDAAAPVPPASLTLSPPEKWNVQGVGDDTPPTAMSALVSTDFDTIKMIRGGSITGLSTRLTTPVLARTLTVTIAINGVPGTLSIAHTSASNPSGGEATQAAGIDTFVAGDLIGIQYETELGFVPVDSAVDAWLDMELV